MILRFVDVKKSKNIRISQNVRKFPIKFFKKSLSNLGALQNISAILTSSLSPQKIFIIHSGNSLINMSKNLEDVLPKIEVSKQVMEVS